MTTTTTLTGADQAAARLAGRLRAAGWKVNTSASNTPSEPHVPGRRNVFLHADSGRVTGYAKLMAFWSTVTEAPAGPDGHDKAVGICETGSTAFHGGEIEIGDIDRRDLTEAQMTCWLDAIIAVGESLQS